MKTIFTIFLVSFSILGISAEKAHSHKKELSISNKVESELQQIKKQIEKLEEDLKESAKKKKEDAQGGIHLEIELSQPFIPFSN